MEVLTKVSLRNLEWEDFLGVNEAMESAYAGIGGESWTEKQVKTLLKIFPEGQICVLVDERVAAVALSIVVDYNRFGDNHNYRQITGSYSFSTHDAEGDVLYGIDMFVHPDFRGMRLGRRLYEARKELCEKLNLRSMVVGGRLPGYHLHAETMNPREYISAVRRKEIIDPTLTFQLKNDFHIKRVLKGYLVGDTESCEYATLLEWVNIYYEPSEQLINATKTNVRLGLVQWQMRLFKDFDALVEQIEYFVDAVSDYQSDFVVFPEFFEAPLMAAYNHLGEALAIRELAKHTEPLRVTMSELAVAYNVNIITGSMPSIDEEDGKLYNISYLCRRDGTYESYRKVHITPSESEAWGMVGGDRVRIINTDCGKIGILICYDVEFPELARLYAQQGMQILFVPFLTDTQNGYNRVRRCAQARAIENECYVAIAGCVGNLPRVNNMDIQFAQSAIFTPSDFAFPTDAIKAEATPNTEMVVIADVNLDLLKELHNHGSVRTLKDRRHDLYEVVLKK